MDSSAFNSGPIATVVLKPFHPSIGLYALGSGQQYPHALPAPTSLVPRVPHCTALATFPACFTNEYDESCQLASKARRKSQRFSSRHHSMARHVTQYASAYQGMRWRRIALGLPVGPVSPLCWPRQNGPVLWVEADACQHAAVAARA